MTLYLRPPGRSGESARSASSRKLERGDDFQIEKTRLEFRNEHISNHTLGRSSMNLWQKLNLLHGLTTMEGHAQKCVEGCCELANKKTKQLYTVSTPCLDGHSFKKEELGTGGELSDVCSRIVVKCLFFDRNWWA